MTVIAACVIAMKTPPSPGGYRGCQPSPGHKNKCGYACLRPLSPPLLPLPFPALSGARKPLVVVMPHLAQNHGARHTRRVAEETGDGGGGGDGGDGIATGVRGVSRAGER